MKLISPYGAGGASDLSARVLGELWEDDRCDFTDVTVGVGRLQQLLRECRAIAPVLVLGLTPVLVEAMPFADVLWYDLETLRHYEALDARFGFPNVLGGLCFISATLGADGEILHLGKPAKLTFGERDGGAASARDALTRLNRADGRAWLREQVHRTGWQVANEATVPARPARFVGLFDTVVAINPQQRD